jgi:tetratricopeptide (TPR) repeat protein
MNIVLFIIGLIIGPFLNAQIIFPVIYFFPKSLVLTIKGELKVISIFMSLLTPIIWFVILASIGFFFPSIAENKYISNSYLAFGMNISTIGMLGYAILTKKGRLDLKVNFWKHMENYKFKPLSYQDIINSGIKLFEQGKFNEAINIYKTMDLYFKEYDPKVHLGLGMCYIAIGNKIEAINEYNELTKTENIEPASILFKMLKENDMI